MHLKTYVLVGMVLVLALGVGCGGGGSSSGGSSSTTIVGTWNLSSTGASMPQQIIFNSDGTGSYSGAPVSSTGATSGTFTWAQTGSTVTLATINNLPTTVGNTITVVSGGATITYTRA